VGVDPTSIAPGDNVTATITISGNGATKTVTIDYGIGTCGNYTPQALGNLTTTGVGGPAPAKLGTLSSAPTYNSNDTIPGQIIVGYNAPSGLATAALRTQALQQASVTVRRAYGLTLLAGGTGHGPDLITTTNATATLAKLLADPHVRYAQPNRRVHLLAVPNDSYYPPSTSFPDGQWNLTDFGLEQAWNLETGASTGGQVVIGIIDSGIDPTHQDLQSKLLPGYDFFANDTTTNPGSAPYNPDQDHGTHVAGIAAALGNNNLGIAGVAYDSNVKILPLKIFNDAGTGADLYNLDRAIRWAAGLADPAGIAPANPNHAAIINMSIGVEGDQPAVDAAALDAWNNGVLLVAASGNHGTGTVYPVDPGVLSPANAPCVMAVGSVDGPYPYPLSYFSNTGPQLEVTAPGGFYNATGNATNAIVSTLPGNSYGLEAGTSMASPFVAGVAALLKAQDPTRSPKQLRNILDGTTWSTSSLDRSQSGYGVVCADRALDPTSSTLCGH